MSVRRADIRQNTVDIQKNSADIRQNTVDIEKNSADIQGLADKLDRKADDSRVSGVERRVEALESSAS